MRTTQATTKYFYPVKLTEHMRQQYEALSVTDEEVRAIVVRPASPPTATAAA